MKMWFRMHWHWVMINVVALMVLLPLLWHIYTTHGFSHDDLIETGKWTIRFLLLSLLMTPLNTLFGWRSALKLRRTLGLWSFGFVMLHFILYVNDPQSMWLQYPVPDYIAALGMIGFVLLIFMAATSTRWAMKHLGKWWKRLHRLVYLAGLVGAIHGLLEIDPKARQEVPLYLVAVVILLAMRLPMIRTNIVNFRHRQFANLLN